MAATRPELLEASDEWIDDVVQYADPMVLRGLLYQLTGDDDLRLLSLGTEQRQMGRAAAAITDPDVIAMIRSKAAAFLKSYRDEGAGDLQIGPGKRLKDSLSLTAGEEVPSVELPMWLEQLALDPFARGLVWSQPPPADRLSSFSVIVIGAGMAGLNASVQLAHAGIPFKVLEKNSGVGGTWYENRYPGCRVDTASRTYTHIFGATYVYPYEYCRQEENEKYVNWVADHYDVRKYIELNTEVTSLHWEDDEKIWVVTARDPDGEKVFRANVVITGVGFLSRPNVADIAGLDDFAGRAFHSARWPSDLDVTGKRVAVIGSGCTGYQLSAEIAHDVEHLYLFQRTPSWVFDVPGYLSPYPPQVNWLDRNFPYLPNFVRFRKSWLIRPRATAGFNEVDPDFEDPYAVSAENKVIRVWLLCVDSEVPGRRAFLIA